MLRKCKLERVIAVARDGKTNKTIYREVEWSGKVPSVDDIFYHVIVQSNLLNFHPQTVAAGEEKPFHHPPIEDGVPVTAIQIVKRGSFFVRVGTAEEFEEIEIGPNQACIFRDWDPNDEYDGHGSKVGPEGCTRLLLLVDESRFRGE